MPKHFYFIFLPFLCCYHFCSARSLQVGDLAPSFTCPDENGIITHLSQFQGKKVILFFYPKNNSPHCTTQVCSLRDNYEIFKKNGVVLIGVNYDSSASHHAFKKKYNLPFILLSDRRGALAKAYGACGHWWNYFVPQRKTFLINEKGIITHILSDVDVSSHTTEIANILGLKG